MLAGCSSSSTLISPRHRLRSEGAGAQFQACHYPMNTQRLDLPRSFSCTDATRSQPIRPVGISVEKQIEPKTSCCSLKTSIRLPPLATTSASACRDGFWEKGKSLKRFAEQGCIDDESCSNRAKRLRANGRFDDSLGQLGSDSFWISQGFAGLTSPPPVPFSLTCSSGEEERVCFEPSDVIRPPFPNNPNWVESVVNEITSVGERKDVVKEASGSSSSSDSHSSGFRLNEAAGSEHEVGNNSRNHPIRCPHEGTRLETVEDEDNQVDHQGFELISLLTACVEAIGSKNIPGINHFIARLGELASPRGATISRLAAYYTEALALRVTRLWPHIFHITIPREFDRVDEEPGSALRLFNQVSPIPKFIHFTSNEILLKAFEGKDKVHVIDFDIKQGLQWPSFFQSLACRTNPPSHVRITSIGDSKLELNETGDRLAGFAEALNLPFEFHPVVDRLEDVRLWMLHVKENETVAINCVFQLHKTLYNGGAALRDFLGLIRSTSPEIVVMAEQEADHNGLNLEARVANSLKHYSALFDSIDYSLPLDSAARIKIEEMFAREIRNVVSCEGSDRHERHEGFDKWRTMMEQGGFRNTGISERAMLQSQMLLKMYCCEKFNVVRRQGQALTLSWLDQNLYTVSAWSPVDFAGNSSRA